MHYYETAKKLEGMMIFFVPVALLGDYSPKTIFEDEEFLSLDQSIFSFLVLSLEDDQRSDQGMQN